MSDLLELDLLPADRVGFRLQRFELYNWGTFDGQVWTLDLAGGNGLLTGDIGSGKSTLVDGLTTLLVPPARVSYNKAAGASARERTLTSYVLGHYKSERSELGSTARPVALRGPGSYSALMAVFGNEGLGQHVSLAQVFWHRDAAGPVARLHVVADRELSITRDLAGFDSDIAVLRRRLRASGAALHESFSAYSADFRRRMGIDSAQALDLFHQTVSMKSVGNLTDFVREHMLDAADMGPRIANLISHVEDLTRAHDAVLTARAQVEALRPLVADLDEHAAAEAAAARDRRLRDGLRAAVVAHRCRLLEARIDRNSGELDRLSARRERERAALRAAQDEVADLVLAVRERGGDRLEQIGRDIEAAEAQRARRQQRSDDYRRLCEELDLAPAGDAAALAAQQDALDGLVEQVEQRRAQLDGEHSELAVAGEQLRRRRAELDAELASLADRDSNIDAQMVALRRALAEQVGVPVADLPFAGELLAVSDPVWQPAAERLLRGFGLSLLVPDRHYAAVSGWVDATNLRGRLVYYRVRGAGPRRHAQDSRSLVHRIEVKAGEFADWLQAEVVRRFDLVCAASAEEFRGEPRALSRAGQVKSGGERHEKDDRIALGDRRFYVLGWDNAEKRAALAAERDRLDQKASRAATRLQQVRAERSALDRRAQHVALLRSVGDYAELDWAESAARVVDLRRQADALTAASDVLAELTARLDSARAAADRADERCSGTDRDIGALHAKVQADRADLESLRAEPGHELAPDEGAELEAQVQRACGDRPLTLVNAEAIERAAREELTRAIDASDKRALRAGERALRAMAQFRSNWPLASQEMDAAVAAGGEYRALLSRLVADDIPRFEAAFKRQLNVNAIREVVAFRAALDTAQQEIRRRVGIINDSLAEIAYQPETYIRLEVAATTDPDVRDFRAQLRACTEDSLTGSGDDQYSEAKFLQVKAIVSRLVGREGRSEEDRRWTAKVTDVRTWFTFAASERRRDDDTEHEHYSDSGGKSGGQKEKLAYTILAASLAYQFGLVSGQTHSRTFRFVVIDEAFGRGSDESARFGLQLFGRLQLQLLVVTPLQKIHVIEPYVQRVGFVHTQGGNTAKLRNLAIEEYRDLRDRAEASRASVAAPAR